MTKLARTSVALFLCMTASGKQAQSGINCSITLQKATNLKDEDHQTLSDPYVKVSVIHNDKQTHIYTTKVIQDDLNPVWSELTKQQFDVGDELKFTVKDQDNFSSTLLGKCTITPKVGKQDHKCALQKKNDDEQPEMPARGTLFFTTVCQSEGDPCQMIACPVHQARHVAWCPDGTGACATTDRCCVDLMVNTYASEGTSETLVISQKYAPNHEFGIDFTLHHHKYPESKYKIMGFAAMATDDPFRNVQALRRVTFPDGSKWVVKIERTSEEDVAHMKTSSVSRIVVFEGTAAKEAMAPHKDTMVNVLVSEVKLSRELVIADAERIHQMFDIAAKTLFRFRRHMFIRVWCGPHIRIDTELQQQMISKKPFRLFFNEALQSVNGNSGFQNIMFDLMTRSVQGDIRVAQSRMYAVDELFSNTIVKAKDDEDIEPTLDGTIPHDKPQKVPLRDAWHIHEESFVQGDIVLYSNDALTAFYRSMFPDKSDDEMTRSRDRMTLWENMYGDAIADQILTDGADWGSYRDYAEKFNAAVKSSAAIPWASVTCSIALNGVRTRGESALSQKAKDAMDVIDARTRHASVDAEEIAKLDLGHPEGPLAPDTHPGQENATVDAAEETGSDDEDEDDENDDVDDKARAKIDYQQVQSSLVVDAAKEPKKNAAINNKIKEKFSKYMSRSLRRKWSMICVAAFSAFVQGLVPVAYAVLSTNPVAFMSGILGGSQRGMLKYMDLQQEMRAAEDHLKESPLALLDVCVSFYEFITYVISHGGYIELRDSDFFQFYLPQDKTISWKFGQLLNPLLDRLRHHGGTRPPISLLAPEIIMKNKVWVLDVSREEMATLAEATKFLRNFKYVDLGPADIKAAATMGLLSDGYSRKLKYFIEHFDAGDMGALFGSIAKIGAENLFNVEAWGDGANNPLNDLGLSHAQFLRDNKKDEVEEKIKSLGETVHKAATTGARDEPKKLGGAAEMMKVLRPKVALKLLRLTSYLDSMTDAFGDGKQAPRSGGPAHLRAYTTFQRIVNVYNGFGGTEQVKARAKERLYFDLLDALESWKVRGAFRLSFEIYQLKNGAEGTKKKQNQVFHI